MIKKCTNEEHWWFLVNNNKDSQKRQDFNFEPALISKHWIQFKVETIIFELRLLFDLRLKFFKFGLRLKVLNQWKVSISYTVASGQWERHLINFNNQLEPLPRSVQRFFYIGVLIRWIQRNTTNVSTSWPKMKWRINLRRRFIHRWPVITFKAQKNHPFII